MKLIGLPAGLLIGTLLAAPATPAQDAAEAEQDLLEIRERIEALQAGLAKRARQRGETEKALREAEKAEAAARKALAGLRQEQENTRRALAELEEKARAQRGELQRQSDELARQLRIAYVAGQEQWLRIVLSEEAVADAGRKTVYYEYFARARGAVIAGVRESLRALAETMNKLDDEQQRLAGLEASQRERLEELSAARGERETALARLDSEISEGSGEVDRLERQAAELETLVKELTRALAGLDVGDDTPFGETRGRLAWPVEGRIIGNFGDPRGDGQLRRDGVLLGATPGSEVRAVHHGRVVFADWLTGMGLLVIVEHGDGYLSLYGHNQDIVRDVGEWVAAGDVIAHVGDSGGQAVPGLYFEIRKDGQPVNPNPWVAR